MRGTPLAKRKRDSELLAYLRSLMRNCMRRQRPRTARLHIQDLLDAWERQQGRCALTGVPMSHTYSASIPDRFARNASLDRIDPAQDYTRDNIMLTCHIINQMRWYMTVDEFRWWCNRVMMVANGLAELFDPADAQRLYALQCTEADETTFT